MRCLGGGSGRVRELRRRLETLETGLREDGHSGRQKVRAALIGAEAADALV